MKKNNERIGRRDFLKTVGAAGVGSVIGGCRKKNTEGGQSNAAQTAQDQNEPAQQKKESKIIEMPRRPLGKTGVDVPVLSLGAMFDVMENQIVLRKTLEWGVNYWDTSTVYANGNSELGIGKFLEKNPKLRKDVFIVSKALRAHGPDDYERLLQQSLERMKTDYLDMYYLHDCREPGQLTDTVRQWAEGAKKRGLIKLFGTSIHKNMAVCLEHASKLSWIDAIMTVYNFRLMQDDALQRAVDACHKAGIGLVAMKTQAYGSTTEWAGLSADIETEADKKIVGHFLEKGFTKGQAKIKAVMADERFTSVCVSMNNVGLLLENVAAAVDKTKLTQEDMQALKEYARATCDGYCAGCANICSGALPEVPYINEIMRYLMYYNNYGDRQRARELFARIPAQVRGKLLSTDYSVAEARCPQHMPIGRLMAEAVRKLT